MDRTFPLITRAYDLATTPAGLEPFFLGYGVLGAMFVLVLLGWLRPKWDSDAAAKREAYKDEVILKLTDALQRLADKHEARS